MSLRIFMPHKIRVLKWYFERLYGEKFLNLDNNGIINFIDVGAIGWLPYPWSLKENVASINHLLRFEPQERASSNPDVTTLDLALWDEDCERDFFIFSGENGGASLFEQNLEYVSEHYHELKECGSKIYANTWFRRSKLKHRIKIKCRTLDSVLEELNQHCFYHFIKIDAQGAEYQILKGADKFLETSCIGLQLELFTVPILKGVVLKPEIVAYLENKGFDLVLEYAAHGTFNSQQDCVFLKRDATEKMLEVIKSAYQLV